LPAANDVALDLRRPGGQAGIAGAQDDDLQVFGGRDDGVAGPGNLDADMPRLEAAFPLPMICATSVSTRPAYLPGPFWR